MKKKTLGLALGAGSTKGFAHIGVLQVLREQKIPIDMIAGSSMGAIIGAIHAVGGDMYILQRYLHTISFRNYMDIANPFNGGLMRGNRLQELIKTFTHNKDFSQTEVPFVCVAVDVASGELVTFDSGKLHEAVRASMSMPAFFQPAHIDGKTYVDGGILDRVPVKALKERGMDYVIGVDVGYRGEEVDTGAMNAYQLTSQTINIMQWEISKLSQKQADVMIVPPVRQFVKSYFQMDMLDRSIEEGRRATEEALPEIRALLEKKTGWRSLIKLSGR